MKRILVATDFSTRSDRAVRRATLLARKFEAAVSLVHVIDDDRPKRIVDTERELTSVLLGEQARSVREIDGVDCSAEVLLGAPSDEMIKAAQAGMADILVIGPHRHHAFLDVFRGTTAERTIRSGSHPLLVANGVPAGFYRHILAAVDLSEGSGNALRALADLGLDKLAAVSVVYVFSAPARSHMAVASASSEDIEDYLAGEKKRAGGELAEFLRGLAISPTRQVLKLTRPWPTSSVRRRERYPPISSWSARVASPASRSSCSGAWRKRFCISRIAMSWPFPGDAGTEGRCCVPSGRPVGDNRSLPIVEIQTF